MAALRKSGCHIAENFNDIIAILQKVIEK